ncbi:hypothetical protein F53441_871 [Fusarium austroafricanum]|uniref:Major facilitator superfamily (MFS) profile domain-containing protein n=1 Tax=Fusarium austroafricanum TaxID=2364996 RepID=A0A8H4P4M1_9HYPO|nr:hypothetical protein F53441_871 [Fusarium austroafricanum]
MEGYDTLLLSSLFGQPAFIKGFGERQPDGTYAISAAWQSVIPNIVKVGQIFGLFIAGWATDRFGFLMTVIFTCVVATGLIFMQFLAGSIEVLLAAQLLLGFPLGAFLTMCSVYAAEICPMVLRPYLTSWVNLCWTIAPTGGTKYPLRLNGSGPPVILLGTLFAPESPWWYVRHDRLDDARRSLRLLRVQDSSSEEIEATLANMILPLCGFAITGYVTYFFQQAGFDAKNAFNLSLGNQGIALVGGLIAWSLLPHFGRRQLFLWGLTGSTTFQLAIGFLGIPKAVGGIAWATGFMMMLYMLVYSITIGPLCYIVVTEIGSTRLRNKQRPANCY